MAARMAMGRARPAPLATDLLEFLFMHHAALAPGAGRVPAAPSSPLAATDWRSIDWSRPWLASLRAVGQPLALQVAQGLPVHQALNAARPPALEGLHFVPQGDLPEGMAYEAFIRAQRCVPTRDNLHDFFNGLVWLHWPQLKRHLNRLQAAEIARAGVGAQRGPLRDALTVLDENGAIWLAPQPLIDALRAREWTRLMVDLRGLWAHSRLLPVGHALMEKLVQPRKPITAHVLCVPLPPAGESAFPGVEQCPARWDDLLANAAALGAAALAAKPFSPLPVLGVPGWWPQNEDFSFYDDCLVFRSQRPTNTKTTRGAVEETFA